MKLDQRCQAFIKELGVPVTKFCQNIKLSRTSLYDWMNGKINLSHQTLTRIDEYLKKYGF